MSKASVLFTFLFAVAMAPAAEYRISGPYTRDNLSIYLIHGAAAGSGKKLLTLQEAMSRKLVAVYETGNVNELSIENLSAQDVYIQSGDIVKGGRQDRVIPTDFVLPSNSGKIPISSFCVESGRWTKRGSEAADRFTASNNQVSMKQLKLAVNGDGGQQQVWNEVAKARAKMAAAAGVGELSAASPTSMQLALENRQVEEGASAFVRALVGVIENKADVIGFAVAINGKVSGADIYASHELFVSMWPKLLHSTAVEALAERAGAKSAAPPDSAAVQAALAEADRGRQSSRDVAKRLEVVTRESEKTVLYETRDRVSGGAWIHRSLIVK